MENQVSFEDIKHLFKETDRRLDERIAETDRRMDERIAETDRRMDLRLNELGKQIGGLGNRLGEFVEGVVRPGLVRLFRERGVDVRETHRDLEAERNGRKAQVDLLVVNDIEVVVVEVKSKLSQRDVEEHLDRLALFKSCSRATPTPECSGRWRRWSCPRSRRPTPRASACS
ncbi:MAG: hypothetical protein M0R80_19935 [Proteobacteria bacterium]|jgi:hypothetical protein|nr:hypothetical protein [Pseudomonadota bacterium]